MERKKHICVITSGYPTPQTPTTYTFLEQLVCSMADMGLEISVVYPNSFLRKKRTSVQDSKLVSKQTKKCNLINIYRPDYLSLSDKKIAGISTAQIGYSNFVRAVKNVLKKMDPKPDILYSHFLAPAGCCAAVLGKKFNIPSFCAFGESELWSISFLNKNKVRRQLNMLTGIISVSSENKRILLENEFSKEENIALFPNGVAHNLFYPRDKMASRKKFGFPEDAVIGIFIGNFNETKQPDLLQSAAVQISGLKMIYIGGGKKSVKGDNILFSGRVGHDDIPDYLSAADFFVLPTLAEGCCNAVIEAMACGLPIISSNRAFHDDILSDEYSIRIDPTMIEEIKMAMQYLIDHPDDRKAMRIAAYKASLKFDIEKRVRFIVGWMMDKAEESGYVTTY